MIKIYSFLAIAIILILNFFILIIPVLINVAFITLLERKILGYRQLRKGPNKVGIIGFPQPFNDAIKLFSKEIILPFSSNYVLFFIAPAIGIFISLLVWLSLPIYYNNFSRRLTFLFIYTIISIRIYPIIGAGWASNRNYASIGTLRGVSQTISYEVSFALLLLFIFIIIKNIRLISINFNYNFLVFLPLIFLWLIISIAETNRTPFDFAEGESELVSGFNIEYGSVGFALIFIAEYARIYFIRILISIVFFFNLKNYFVINFVRTIFVFVWIWIRTTFPRYRYDLLINIAWIILLPRTLFISCYSIILI